MRLITATLACLGLGALVPALATPTAEAPAPAASVPSAASVSAPVTTAAPGSSPRAAEQPVIVTGTPPISEGQWERHLLAKGYHMEMRNGQKTHCRREDQPGTRLGNAKNCSTAQTLKASEDRAQNAAHEIQKSYQKPVT